MWGSWNSRRTLARTSTSEKPGGRRSWSAWLLKVASVAVAASMLGPATVSAHEDGTPSPNGASPWNYSESWAITGNWYGEGDHVDWYGGNHLNDYYAIDFAVPGDGCNKRLYPIWDAMSVTRTDPNQGLIEMQKTINGQRYRLRYLHLNSIVAGVGQTVGTANVIGYSGSRGFSTGCHLHISVHRLMSDGWWHSIPPQFCARTYPHDHATRWRGC